MSFSVNQAGSTFNVFDADILLKSCAGSEIEVDWWYSVANKIIVRAGHAPSVANLIMLKSAINALSQSQSVVDIKLQDNYGTFSLSGWSLNSSRAINPSDDPLDPNTLYLAEFLDHRRFLSDSVPLLAYNLVSDFEPEPSGAYDPSNPAAFPYFTPSLNGGSPWTLTTLIDDLWNTLPSPGSYLIVGTLPTQIPLDIRPENRSSWKLLHDLLWSIGYLICPGDSIANWRLVSIDTDFGTDPLTAYSGRLIDTAHLEHDRAVLPATFRFAFQSRRRKPQYKQYNPFYFVAIDTAATLAGLSITGATVASGVIETVTTEAMTAVYKEATTTGAPENDSHLQAFALNLCQRIIKHRLTLAIERVYAGYIAIPPNALWQEVEYSVSGNGPSTAFRSLNFPLPSLPEMDRVGNSDPPLRRFELVANKLQTDLTAQVKFLDYDGDHIGDPVTVADPAQAFYGKIADWISGEDGFEGYALLQRDLEPVSPGDDRWVIVSCEGFAEIIVARWEGSPTSAWVLDSFFGDQWEWRRPAADSGLIGTVDLLSLPAPDNGEKRLAILYNPDTSPPTYQFLGGAITGGGEVRRFQLTAAKTRAQATATAKWLDHAGNMVGGDITLHDPSQRFYGKITDYISGERGFQGYAMSRPDLAETDPDPSRWEIITCEGFAETVVCTWVGSPTNEWQLDSFSGDQWEWRRPVADAAALTINDPLSFPSPTPGEKRIFHLLDPDTSPPTYQVRTVKQVGGGQRVRGQVVGNITTAAATFTIDNLSNVFGADPLPASPLTVQQSYPQGYVDNQLTEAIFNETTGLWHNLPHPVKANCHLAVDANGFLNVTPATLAGTGLAVEGTGCQKLAVDGSISIAEGYCTEIEVIGGGSPDKMHFDAITAAAGAQATGINVAAFQFWIHEAGATARTDAKWKTASNYSISAGEFQFLSNEGGTWEWETVDGYDDLETQLVGHVNGAWAAKTIADWLKLLPGYAAGSEQVLGHGTDGAPEWKTVVSDTINNPTAIDLDTPTLTSLKVTLDYTPVTVKTWPATSDGAGTNFNDTEVGTDCLE